MAYYDVISSESLYTMHSRGSVTSFEALYISDKSVTGVSRWSTPHLYASRVICAKPDKRLAIFSDDEWPQSTRGVHECIDSLIDGPIPGFRGMFESQIVQHYRHHHQADGLGYVWAALARLLQAELQAVDLTTDRTMRDRRPPVQHQDYVSSESMQVGSSPPAASMSGSTSSVSSLNWVDNLSSAPLEGLTLRLASCFIRCVINYAQSADKLHPVHFRDEHLANVFQPIAGLSVEAIDDGGLQLQAEGQTVQVATIEGKRAFQEFTSEGIPTVSDKTLAQLVGQALARRRDVKIKSIQQDDHISILVVTRYVKFFHFNITNDFIAKYEKPAPETDYLRVSSTLWFDLARQGHREKVVEHILAILTWAEKHRAHR
ncbi:hypothetical protein HIM_10274 [Hirsutella minnesotensis 3608]|uniref:Uncharacterized protein n=1 Tax=Hirsutella minnesotensis 3608 TaxID=1043627 RepID=A0A0F7ZK99_9HYPO|nr:hypothetical protein HIM_10274 [Hirsutella minnesotensis 3608]